MKSRTSRDQGKLNALKGHILNGEIEAAQLEAQGETVAVKASGVPYDHIKELQDAANGLQNLIQGINKALGSGPVSEGASADLQSILGQASKLLDLVEGVLP